VSQVSSPKSQVSSLISLAFRSSPHDLVAKWLERETVATQNIKARAKGTAKVIGREFVSLITMAVKRGGHADETILRAIDEAIVKHQNAEIEVDLKSMLRQTMYNVAGWMIKTSIQAKSRRKDDSVFKSALEKILTE
jgi:hypothetical protein